MAGRLWKALDTTVALSDKLNSSLSSPSPAVSDEHPSPLLLLSASTQALKSQATKISLLAINTPFTPSAICTILSEVNDSALPSLTAAALLLSPAKYTQTFHGDAKTLVQDILHELTVLIRNIKNVSIKYEENKSFRLGEDEKHGITTATGRVWKVCDQIATIASDGVVGLVIKKAKEHLELVQDCIRELKEWDPENDDGDDGLWDDEFGDDGEDDTQGNMGGKIGHVLATDGDEDSEEGNRTGKLVDEKNYLLRLFTLTTQLYTAIIAHRLKKITDISILPKICSKLDTLTACLRDLPNLVDEAAGSLYEGNLEFADAYSLKLRDRAFETIDLLREPWAIEATHSILGDKAARKEVEDKFSEWGSVWLKVADELVKDREE
ncbi:hypothetical protein LOZ12_005322 [Ophidiomyces ophidiicola]|uniref:Uncharacterized protein n=1 Tax=Ophidiomyces ophidiicola TaxID=1387563 RepID=A0ACB8UQV5_9EURO|nr:uncharacterized protein LOZ57_002397 [Ophidiomyces ophidiicola]KAI1909295.1 hypothetical protein LOZ64_005285 [Ophidiomyces ophidiicola]KAI1910407.1 hypothetical protein LOZ61_004422 [Ophidiomyces ophidiicola]KAI1922470.1 hypothetical protein LOZ60_005694 [Ophidiomyces ophidiicola]KAI1937344.1 hypothetical protein LOZ62_005506 [Ophidiomyces ophidiicola]KAI1949916.1 hypothetical protein LOZ57_002397 [Ophidiomyces ophidiicola]